MKWLKVVWQWLNAPALVRFDPPADDGALRVEHPE